MSDERTSDEAPQVDTDTPEPVPEADALEQAEEVAPVADEDDPPTEDPEVPEADAIEQSRTVPIHDDDQR
jgi:hypothetical protein